MATTDITINVQVSTNTFAFPFPYLKTEDVRVELREFDTTPGVEEPLISTSASTNFTIPEANPTTIEFTSLGAATIYQNADGTVKVTSDNNYQVQVRIYRNTTADATPATFFAGSAVRAKDLNDNFEKILYIMQERQNFLSNIIAGQFPTESLTSSAFETNSVTSRVLRDDTTIDSNRAVTTNHIRDNAVTMAKLAGGALPTDITVSTANIIGNTIVDNDISNSAAIAQSKLDLSITDSEVSATANISGSKISPNFIGQNITTLGNLSVNDATISGTATISSLTYPTSDGSPDEVLKTNGSGTLSFGAVTTFTAGMILMWSGTIATIPAGWALCDGQNSTPDLRNKFVVAAADDSGTGVTFNADTGTVSGNYAPGDEGGSVAHQLTIDEMPSHSHTVYNQLSGSGGPYGEGGSTSTVNSSQTGSRGGSDYHENRPPYYALAFIMKT